MSSVTTVGVRALARTTLAGAALAGCLLVGACTRAAEPGMASPSAAAASPSAPGPSSPGSPSATPTPDAGPAALVIDVTIADGKVTPSGRKISVEVGQLVTLRVTSDEDDQIHVHTGGDGFELEVPAGKQSTGSFTLTSAGSFEVESHHLEKIIVILNAS